MGGNYNLKKNGKEYQAEKINLKDFGVSWMQKECLEILRSLDKKFKSKYKQPLWPDFSKLEIGKNFNGSTSAFFDPKIDKREYLEKKPLLGDLDVACNLDLAEDLAILLHSLEFKDITKNTTYIGCNVEGGLKDQATIISLWEVKKDNLSCILQIDFELVDFIGDEQDEFFAFSKSSSWKDIQVGLKGVCHKFLLTAMIKTMTVSKNSIVVTPSSTYDNIKPVKVKGDFLYNPSLVAFSVDRGIRTKYSIFQHNGENVYYDGKLCYKELPSKGSTYNRELRTIMALAFGYENVKDLPDDCIKPDSFVELSSLVSKYMTNEQKDQIFNYLVSMTFKLQPNGKIASQLCDSRIEHDSNMKMGLFNELFKNCPYLAKYKKDVEELAEKYYKAVLEYHSDSIIK